MIGVKINYSEQMINFIRENYKTMTSTDMAKHLGVGRTNVRTKMYSMGLKKIELEYWTQEMVQFLLENYKTMGDTEMAQYFQDNFPKKKLWTKKHIEKKRRQMGLKRNLFNVLEINERNRLNGAFVKNHWRTKGEINYPEGSIHLRNIKNRMVVLIKHKGFLIYYAPYLYKKHFGDAPKGYVVSFKDGNQLNCNIDNLCLKSRADLAKENHWKNFYKKDELKFNKNSKKLSNNIKIENDKIPLIKADILGKKPVVIDAKTTIWVPIDKDPELAKRIFLEKTKFIKY